jgi:hypothetical protein
MKEAEIVAMGKMRAFCARILKALAPPLLREIQATSALRSDAEPFTPRRCTRSNPAAVPPAAKQSRKATAAEAVLLKALGITQADLNVDENACLSALLRRGGLCILDGYTTRIALLEPERLE